MDVTTRTNLTPTFSRTAGWLGIGLLLASFGGTMALAAEESELHQTHPLAAGGRISLDNVNGAVRIHVWDRPEVKLDAVKRADTREQLEAVKIEIEAKPDRLTVRTKYPVKKWWSLKRDNDSVSVDYTLTVPASVRLDRVANVNGAVEIDGVHGSVKASTVNGALRVKGLAANANLSTVNGGIKVGFASLTAAKSVSLSTVNGGVELDLPIGANADVSANTVNGGISGDVSVKKHWPLGAEVKTRLGEGGTKVHASTVNGGVQIHLAGPAK